MTLTCKAIRLLGLFLLLTSASAYAGGSIRGKVVHANKRWTRDTVVYLEHVKGDWKPQEAKMDQRGSTFIPQYLPIIVGSKVTFLNSDPTDHNVYSPDNEKYDLGVKPKGGMLEYTFKKAGVYTQLCKLHPKMIAYIIVLPNPFYGMSDKDGVLTITNVPPGRYKLITWNERYKADPVEVEVKEGEATEVEIALHR